MDAFTPPSWSEGGSSSFLLGTDQQGRDMLSTIIYGSRISLIVGFASILFAMILGVVFGTYSSIFIANPILIKLKVNQKSVLKED